MEQLVGLPISLFKIILIFKEEIRSNLEYLQVGNLQMVKILINWKINDHEEQVEAR